MPRIVNPSASNWTRITVVLPVNTQSEINACLDCRNELDNLCDVFTYNANFRMFVKYYQPNDPSLPRYVSEYVCIQSGDINLPMTDIKFYLAMLNFEVHALQNYKIRGAPIHGEIWITASVIHKISSGSPLAELNAVASQAKVS
jgi:hypothetical protein